MADEKIQQAIESSLKDSETAEGKIDAELLRKNNPPLASVLDIFIMGKTTRDDRGSVVKDLALAFEARDPNSRLNDALKKLEDHLKSD